MYGTELFAVSACRETTGDGAISKWQKRCRNGATLVIVNREPTGLDSLADLVLNRAIGETLGAAIGVD